MARLPIGAFFRFPPDRIIGRIRVELSTIRLEQLPSTLNRIYSWRSVTGHTSFEDWPSRDRRNMPLRREFKDVLSVRMKEGELGFAAPNGLQSAGLSCKE